MSNRVCPKCKSELGSYDNHYCSSCGEKLPQDLVQPPSMIKKRVYTSKIVDTKGELAKKLVKTITGKTFLLSVVLLTVILLAAIWIASSGIVEVLKIKIREQNVSLNNVVTTTKDVSTETNVTTDWSLTNITFGDRGFSNYIPHNVSLYVEFGSLEGALSIVSFVNFNKDLASKAGILLEKEFATFSYRQDEEIVWGYLFLPKDKELVQNVISNIEHGYWSLKIVEEVLVVTSNKEVFDKVESIVNKTEKSLSQNSVFVEKVSGINSIGGIQVIYMDDQVKDIVRNSLEGLDQESINTILKHIEGMDSSFVVTGLDVEDTIE